VGVTDVLVAVTTIDTSLYTTIERAPLFIVAVLGVQTILKFSYPGFKVN
jgi:hypothetical protein